jgi:nucleotide-binding universal stress UspA family protein
MKKIIAALDNSLAAMPVLKTAQALGKLLGAVVEAIHVDGNGNRIVRAATDIARVPLRFLDGDVVEAVIAAAEEHDVVLMVVGARATPGSDRSLGTTALSLAERVRSPLVVVPPVGKAGGRLRRILVPVEAGVTTDPVPEAIVEIAQTAGAHALDVVVLHVLEERRLPAFTDQPQHEHPAWAGEFVRRFCPWGIGTVSLEVRVGRSEELVAQAARESDVDLVALGWAQELREGRAPVVRRTLERSRVPVMLVPVRVVGGSSIDDALMDRAAVLVSDLNVGSDRSRTSA